MKNTVFIVIVICTITFVSCNKQVELYDEIKWASEIPEASIDKKIALIDFYGVTCGPCIKMFEETFPDSAVTQYVMTHFYPVKIDAWADTNKVPRDEYNVRGVPLIVFLNEDMQELERIIGFKPAEEFLAELQRIVKGEGTYIALLKQYQDEPDNPEVLYKLCKKERIMKDPSDSVLQGRWEKLMAITDEGCLENDHAKIMLATQKMWDDSIPDGLITLINSMSGRKFLTGSYNEVLSFYRYKAKDTAKYADFYKEYIERIIEDPKVIPELKISSVLNRYSWEMTKVERNLDDALEKVNIGISKLAESTDTSFLANIIDTKAEVLWKLGRTAEAIEEIDQSIELFPEKEYYQEQKKKYEADLKD